MHPPLGAGGIMFLGCPSVRPTRKPEIPSFDLYMGPLVHPTNRDRFTACPSVRPEKFPGICRRSHGGNGLKFYMLMYLDLLQNWLVYGHGLLIFLILALFWLSETGQIWGFRAFPGERMEKNGLKFCTPMYLDHLQNWLVHGHGLLIFLVLALFWLSETDQIWGFRAFPGERMEGMAWNFACWCILTTFSTD